MAQKVAEEKTIPKKKHNIVPYNKEDGKLARTWPDLPQQILDIIRKKPTLIQNIGCSGQSKSWRSASCKHSPINKQAPLPWLELSNTKQNQHSLPNPTIPSLNLPNARLGLDFYKHSLQMYSNTPFVDHLIWKWSSYKKRPKTLHYFLGCSNGLVLAKSSKQPLQYCLWDAAKELKIDLPIWGSNLPFRFAGFSSSHDLESQKNAVLMVLTGLSHPAFVFYRIRGGSEYAWLKQDCLITEPSCSGKSKEQNYMRFTSGIGFKGKFYALSLQGTVVVIEVDSNPRVVAIGKSRAIPSISCRHFVEHLLESDGEVLLVFLVSKSSAIFVDCVEIFKLDLVKLSWIKVESLGERTLFVGTNCCMLNSARKVGSRRNCVYFTHYTSTGWWVYDLESHTMCTCWSNHINSTSRSLFWVEPEMEE